MASSVASATATNKGDMRSFGQSATIACPARRSGVRRTPSAVENAIA